MLADLGFWQTLAVGAFQVLITAVLVAGIAAYVVKRYELEHQTRAALRETYADLLAAQRRSREASIELARAGGAAHREELETTATNALADFLDAYHRLNLDATDEMWRDARGLRDVLEDMLKSSKRGDTKETEGLKTVARKARQNLERSFRMRLGHRPLQSRRTLPDPYDKQRRGSTEQHDEAVSRSESNRQTT